jgi:hypothetical protein
VDLVVGEWDNRVELPTKKLVEGGGLLLAAEPSAMSYGGYTNGTDPVASIRRVPDPSTLFLDGLDGTVVAAWELGLFDAQLDPAWDVAITDAALREAGGDGYEMFLLDHNTQAWTELGHIGWVEGALFKEAALPSLTLLVLVE